MSLLLEGAVYKYEIGAVYGYEIGAVAVSFPLGGKYEKRY